MNKNSTALERIRSDVRSMSAYRVQPSKGLLKMDAMENPFTLPPHLQQALGERLGRLELNRYPSDSVEQLRRALMEYLQTQSLQSQTAKPLPPEHGLVLGNGSDELISLLSMACAQSGAKVLAPQPGFVMYQVSAQLHGLEFVGVDLQADFHLDVPAMLKAIALHRPAITYLAYPNNPTATLWREEDMYAVIDAVAQIGGFVVVDEAYQPFSSHSWLECIAHQPERHQHVFLMHTLSKFGLAGVRLGYMLAPQYLAREIEKVRPPYNVSTLNAEAALFALENAQVFDEQAAYLRDQRSSLIEALESAEGVDRVWLSEANMVLVRFTAQNSAADVEQAMLGSGILIKNVSAGHPLLANCLRLTVGTGEENARMLNALQQHLR